MSDKTGIGTYTIHLKLDPAKAKNYQLNGDPTGTLTIVPAKLTAVVPDQTLTYNGRTQAIDQDAIQLQGVVNGEDVTYTLAARDNDTTNVGQHALALTLADTEVNHNYTLTNPRTGTLTINKAKLAVNLADETVTYNGELQTLATDHVTFLNPVDDKTIGYKLTKSTKTGVGDYTIQISLDPASQKNYELDPVNSKATATLTITPVKLQARMDDATVTYNGQSQTLPQTAVRITGAINNEKILYDLSRSDAGVGDHPITLSLAKNEINQNYVLAGQTQSTLTIEKARLTVTMKDRTVSYNGLRQGLTAGDVVVQDQNNQLFTAYTLTKSNSADAGTYTVKLNFNDSDANYEVDGPTTAKLTITPITLKVAMVDQQTVYTGQQQTFDRNQIVVSGAVAGETPVYTLTNSDSADAGHYQIHLTLDPTAKVNKNYRLSDDDQQSLSGDLWIQKAAMTVIMNGSTVTYNGQQQTLQPSDVQILGAVNPQDARYTLTTSTSKDVGAYQIKLTFDNADLANNYTITGNQSATLKITPAELTARMLAQTATYNGERQTLDRGPIHILGNVPTEHVKYNLTTSDSADVGDHLISLTLDPTEKNYYLSPTSAVLTITPAEVTVYLNDASAVYNGKQQTLAAKDVTITGLLANVDSTYHLTKTAKAGVGQYQISLNFDNPNYQVTGKATAQLTITQAPLTVTLPKAQERTYNGQLQVLDPADVHILGSVAGEAIAYTGGSTAQAGVGHYDVAVQLAKNDINANYVLTGPTSTTIDVLPAPLTIKMQGQSVVYNGRQRTLEADHVQVDGLQGSDGGAYSLSKSAAGVGRYQINLTFNDPAMMKNYTITGPTSAPLTITAAPLTVALTDQTVTYNGQQQTLSGDAVQVTGAVNGEQIRYALNKSSDAKVGQYQINLILADNGVNGNYQLTPESKLNALLNIKKAKLSVRLRNATVNYNGHEQSLPASAVEITGNVPGEQIQYRLTTSQSANTGQYQISFSLLNNSVNQNYEVATAGTATARTARRARMNAESLVLIPTQGPSATLTIKPAEISVKLRDAQKPYDGQTQTLDPRDVIISGLLNGDQLDYRLTQSAGKTAGQYQIHFELTDALMNRNYVLAADSQQPSATLTITKAKLVVIKMANDTVVYNGQRQTLKPSDVQLQGLVNGDQLNYQLTKSADAKVGQYVIRLVLPTDGSGQNYEFENNPSALLTIIPADATIQVHNALAWYDGQEHQPTVSVTGLVNDDQLGYALSAGQTDVGTRQVNAKLDTANATNQNYHVKLIPGTVTVGRVAVHYLDEQGRTLAPATTASHDAQLNYTTQPLTIQGYDVVAEPTGLPANGRLTGVGGTVSYHYQAKTVRARVTYLDATAKTVLAHQDLTGKYGSLSAYRPTVAAYQQQGYVLETSNYPGDGNVFTDLTGTANYVVALSHQLVVVTPATPGQPGQPVAVYPQVNYPAGTGADALTRTITQRVHYVDQNGQPLAADHVATVKFNRTATVDLVTKKVTYTDWLAVNGDQFNAVTTPTIKGYQAVQNQSQVVRVTPDSADNVQTVVYQLVQTDTGSHGNGGTNTGSDNNNHGNGDTTTGPDSDAHGNSGATTGSDTGNPDNDGANTESGTGNHGNGGTTTGTDTGNHDNGGMNTGSGSSNHGNGGTNTGTHPDSQDHHGATAGAHGNGSTGTSSNTGNHHNGEMPTGSQTGSHGNGKVDNQQHGGATTMKQQGLLTKPQVLPGTAAVIDQPTTTQPAPKSAATGKLPRTDEQEKQAASVLGWLVMSLSLLGLGAKKRDARKRKN
ncbi:mucin-binding protein [Lactiplantibacillus garii]|nr:MucBP domain-containing protein [Lactiplantibacillus garii]